MTIGFLIAVGIMGYKYWSDVFVEKQNFAFYTGLFVGITFIFLIMLVYELTFDYSSEIPRDDIVTIEYKRGIPILRKSRIIVHFEKKGKLRKRPLVFSRFQQGEHDKKAALQKLKDAGYYNPGAGNEDLLDI